MEKTVEADIIEYIYERLVKLAMPVTQMPLAFQGFTSPLHKQHNLPVRAILPYNRPEFEQVIQLMLGFERHTKPNTAKSSWNKATPLSRRSYENAIREHNKKYENMCHNHTRLCEVFDLMNSVPDDFIGYLAVTCIQLKSQLETEDEFFGRSTSESRVLSRIEFNVGLAGFDLMNSVTNKKLPAYERNLVARRWEQHCADSHYFTDFSLLIDQAAANGIVFIMDHVTFSH